MNAEALRLWCSGAAAAGLLAGLAVAGHRLPVVALSCALVIIAAQPRWLPRLDLPASLAAAALLVSAQLTPEPATTVPALAAVPMLACVLVVCGTARLPAGIARALFAGCLILAVLVLALVGAFELAKSGELRSTSYPGVEGWGGFPEMGLLGIMTLPVALSLAIGGGPRAARAGAVVAAITAATGLALSGSRAAWGAALLGTTLVLVVHRGGRWRAIVGAVGVALLATVVVATAWLRPQASVGAVSMDVASSSRLTAWSEAAALWRERPIVGWGPSSYRRVYAAHFDRLGDGQFHAHNTYLHQAVETGVVGVASALWLAAAVLAGTGRRVVPSGPMAAAARRGLICGLIVVAVRFVVDYFDPTGAGMRVLLWLSILAGLRLALEAPPDGIAG